MGIVEDRLCEETIVVQAGHGRDTVAQLASAPLFDGIDRGEVSQILEAFDEQSFNAGHRVTLEGYRGSDFYVIARGSAEVTVDGRPVAELGPGDFFGELAVLGDGTRTATVSAETPIRCLVLSNDGLEDVLVAHPRLGYNLLREVAARFRRGTDRGPARTRVIRL